MCGIYGFIGKPTKRTPKVLAELARLNETRGKDSSGIVVVNEQEIQFFKKAINSSKFMEKETVKSIMQSLRNCQFVNFIGHCRQATTGVINDDNAHPFRIGKIYMAHNGVINNFEALQKEFKTSYQVDSQIIGFLLNRYKDKAVFEDKIKGWFTVPYFNIEKQNILRIAKSGAPLSLYYLPKKQGVYYSSETEHLNKALKKAGYKGKADAIFGDKFYQFKWDGNELIKTKDKLNIPIITYNNSYYATSGVSDYYTAKEYREYNKDLLDDGDYVHYWDSEGIERKAERSIRNQNQTDFLLADNKKYLKKYKNKDWYKRWFKG